MRRPLVTVRRPGASMAPSHNTGAGNQTRRENKGAKALRTEANSGGKDGKQDHFPGHLYTTDPSRNGQSRAQGASNKQAARFARGELVRPAVFQLSDAQAGHGGVGGFFHSA